MGTNKYLYENMFRFADSFGIFVSKFWVFVFRIVSYVFSFKAGKCFNSNDQIDTSCYKKASVVEELGPKEEGFEVDVYGDKKFNKIEGETENSVMASSTSKYEFLSGKNISGFIEQPKGLICSVQELYIDSNGEEVIDQAKEDDSVDEVFNKLEEKSFLDTIEVFYQDKTEDFLDKFLKKQEEERSFFDHLVSEKQEEGMFSENEKSVFTEFKFLPKYNFSNEVHFLPEDYSVDSEFDTIGSSDGFSRSNDDIELDAYEFLAERNFSEGWGTESLEAISEEEEEEEEEVESTESTLDQETYDMRGVTFDSDDDFIELKLESPSSSVLEKHEEEEEEEEDLFGEETEQAYSHRMSEDTQLENSAEDLNEDENNHEEEDLVYEARHLGHIAEKYEESSLKDKEFIQDYNYDDDDDDEFALEHDDLLEQLKMELKLARTGGLPTILEESESPPKTVEELKPLKIDHKFEHKDHMKEIHKFYRSYSDKMRKLDILNSQTMHAIGLFQLKGQGQSIQTQKSSVPGIKSLLTQNLWPCKRRRSEANPAFKLIGDLHKDFELVYVGQLCLSWEILLWQYRKALELQDFDSQELRQYNQVASEFQIFQVLLQRFTENEPFQGCPRVQNYVNNRCAHCYFLQVPVIKDDSLKDKKGRKGDGEYAITSPMLTSIIEESMRVYWEFLRAYKDENHRILKCPELQDTVDSELLADIRTDYQKKEKRLKEILRSCSCIVKKLQKHHENRFNGAVFFFAQVELKLISRVLTMSKLTTDQLVWCHEKLAKIHFCNRKLVLEPSFLLFPC